MAADAGQRQAALWHLGRGVVRAARAVPGRPWRRVAGFVQHRILGVQDGQAHADALAGVEARDPRRDHPGDLRHRQIALGRQQPSAMRMRPLAGLVELADHPRAHVVAPVVDMFLELVFDDLAFFLHHQDFVQPIGERAYRIRLQRPGHGHLEQPQADLVYLRRTDAEFLQRLQHVAIRLAGGDDAEACLFGVERGAVEPVDARISDGRVDLVVLHQRFLLARRNAQRVGGQVCVHAIRRQGHILRQQGFDVQVVGRDRARGLHGVGQRLEADRQAGEARHREAVQAQFQVFLHAVRVQERDHRRREQVVALVRQGGRIRAVVVAGDQQHAPLGCRAGVAHVLEHVAAAVHTRRLAVPHGEHAVVVAVAGQVQLLRTPDRGGGQLFVDTGQELDMVPLQLCFCVPQGFVQTAQRRAAVTRHEACGVVPGGQVAPALHEHQAHQRLHAIEIDTARGGRVFVVERNAGKRMLQL